MIPTPQDYLSAKVDADVRNALVVHHRGLVYQIAKACYRPPLPELDDLMQVGYLGVMRALKSFEPERGYSFATYASWWVRNYISMYVRKNRAAVAGMSRQCKVEMERDIDQLTGSKRELAQRRLAASRRAVSLDAPLFAEGDAMIDTMPASNDVHAEVCQREVVQSVRRAVSWLAPRDREIITGRMNNETLESIGEPLNLTRERVRQLEARAHDELRLFVGAVR